MDRIDDASATQDQKFTDGDAGNGVLGTVVNAEFLNGIQEEVVSTIESTGQSAAGADWTQLSKAISAYAAGGSYYTDSGSVNAMALNTVGSKLAPAAYFDGMRAVFKPNFSNNSLTPTVNVAGLGVKPIVDNFANASCAIGSVDTAYIVELIYVASADSFMVLNSDKNDAFNLKKGTVSVSRLPSSVLSDILTLESLTASIDFSLLAAEDDIISIKSRLDALEV
ncbi:MAG: hypothetical protein COB04_16020 [Gammaproteobacteria bacterium]|nr:MAG: hypothetical protein COB04_16020 [Gammaproteobacteria bacterium]